MKMKPAAMLAIQLTRCAQLMKTSQEWLIRPAESNGSSLFLIKFTQ